MIGRFGPMELVIILAIALLIFGPKKLPEIGRALGKTIREFKAHTNKIASEDEDSKEDAKKLSSDESGQSSVDQSVKTESADEESRSS
ncbi:MAG: twin-arginine translocase TatA/TatE family subunit [Spirochaetaceae bacterium]|nr:MAG: twin-arginine translocase TatA/TatE family subunit [Spirochaetaceae bacterium]